MAVGMRAIRAAQALTPKRTFPPECPPEDPRTRQAEVMRKAEIIDAEFVDLIREKESRMACADCGGLFKFNDLHPASGHPEADPVCSVCLEHELLVKAVRNYCGLDGRDGSREIQTWFAEFRTPKPKTAENKTDVPC